MDSINGVAIALKRTRKPQASLAGHDGCPRECTRPCRRVGKQQRESLEDEQQIFHRKKKQARRVEQSSVRYSLKVLLKLAGKEVAWARGAKKGKRKESPSEED